MITLDEALTMWSEYWITELKCCSESKYHYELMKDEFLTDLGV